MRLNLNNQFLNLKGYPLAEKMDDTLAVELAIATTGNPKKMYDWATKLFKDGAIEVDGNDLLFLRTFVNNNTQLTNLAKCQLMDHIDNALNNI